MKSSKAEIHAKFHKIPRVRFCEERRLTSYSGLVVFQALFRAMRLRARIRGCFRHLGEARVFGPASVMVLLVVHIILGFRRLRGLDYYRDDPLVERVCGVRRLPDVATVSRTLASCDDESVENLRELTRGDGHRPVAGVLPRHPDRGLRRLGPVHRRPRRGHRGRLQQEEEGRPQLLPPVRHRRPDLPVFRHAPPPRKRPRLERRRRLHRPHHSASGPGAPRRPARDPRGQRLLRRAHLPRPQRADRRLHLLRALRKIPQAQDRHRGPQALAANRRRPLVLRERTGNPTSGTTATACSSCESACESRPRAPSSSTSSRPSAETSSTRSSPPT